MAEDVKVPEGWRRVRLGDLGEFKTSSVDKKIREKEIPVKLINYMDVYQHNFITKNMELMEVTANRHQFITNRVIKGDVLFTPTSETPDDIGHSAVVLDDLENTVYSYHLIRLRFNNDNSMDIKFRGYVFNSRSILHQFEILATGVTRFTLSKEDFKEVSVIYPESQAKQRKIAEILETIDNAIEKTDAIIEKYKRIKQGLMQDLLTRGIAESDELGVMSYELRDEKKHRFWDSPLGRIPEEWEVVELGEVAEILLSNVDKKIFSNETQVKLCNYLEVYQNDYITLTLNFAKGSVNKNEYQKFKIDKGDVIITKDSETFDDIAKPAFVKDEIPDLICGYHLCLLKPRNIDGLFLAKILLKDTINKHFQKLANGITRFGIAKETIQKAKIPLPPLPEQHRIASVLSQIDEAIEKEQKYKEKLERIKRGLMEDLLTGKVRVLGVKNYELGVRS